MNWGISLLQNTLRILHHCSEESAAWARREQVPLRLLHSCGNVDTAHMQIALPSNGTSAEPASADHALHLLCKGPDQDGSRFLFRDCRLTSLH